MFKLSIEQLKSIKGLWIVFALLGLVGNIPFINNGLWYVFAITFIVVGMMSINALISDKSWAKTAKVFLATMGAVGMVAALQRLSSARIVFSTNELIYLIGNLLIALWGILSVVCVITVIEKPEKTEEIENEEGASKEG